MKYRNIACVIFIGAISFSCSERQRPKDGVIFYLKEDDISVRIFGDCNYKDTVDMGGYFFIAKVEDDCETVSIKRYNSRNGLLEEAGKYHNDFKIETFSLTHRNLSGGEKHVTALRYVLKRHGEWLFYDSMGNIVKRESY